MSSNEVRDAGEAKKKERRRLQLKSLDMLISFLQQKSIVGEAVSNI